MWRLSNKKRKDPVYSGFSWLRRDIHSHLLPGIDDGSSNVETSIELLRHLSKAGIREFVCTPHIIQDLFRNTPETIDNALKQLQAAIVREGLDVHISAAAEYMIDEFFLDAIRSGKELLTLNGDMVLMEFPYTIKPANLEEISFEISTSRYQPLLAHPERYGYFHGNKEMYHRLRELGFMFQLNLLSLTGYYGKHETATAKYLMKEGMIDFVGTDLHHAHHLASLTDKRSVKIFEEFFGDKIYNDW